MFGDNVLVIGVGHWPPLCDLSCLPNGTRINDVSSVCKHPGTDVLMLSMLLQSVKLDGVFVHYDENTASLSSISPLILQQLISGSFDVSGISYGQKYFGRESTANLSSVLELSSSPVVVDGGLFLTQSVNTTMTMSHQVFDIFTGGVWFAIGCTLVVVVGVSWYLSHVEGMSNAPIVNVGCWLFVVLSGVFTNLLAVNLAVPSVSRSPYKNLAELMAKIESGECEWHTPVDVYDAFFTGALNILGNKELKDLVELEEKVPMQLIDEHSRGSLRNVEWIGLDYIVKRQEENREICQVLFTSTIYGTYLRKLAALRGVSIEILPLDAAPDLFGYVFRKGLPALVKEKLVRMTSDKSLPQLFTNILEEMAKDVLRRESKRSGMKGYSFHSEQKNKYRKVAFWQVADFFICMAYGMCASTLFFVVSDCGCCAKFCRRLKSCLK